MLKNLSLLNKITVNASGAIRNLYSASALGIENYITTREKVQNQFPGENEVKFREKMNEYAQDKPGSMIFTEDLKNMAHLIQNKPEDLDLISKMIQKYNSQNKETRFGLFVFGPVLMRMFHHLNGVDAALKLFKDPEMNGFFDQIISFQLMLDMLFENQRYNEVLEIFDNIRSKQIQGGRYPKHCVVLAFAACYKLNTPESFEFCTKLWKDCADVGHMPMRKAATFAAGLALLQNSPQVSLEILSTIKDQSYVTVRNLKILSFARLNRPADALPILKMALNEDQPIYKKKTFLKATIVELKESFTKNNVNMDEFNKLEAVLQENGQLTDDSLDTILTSQIASIALSGSKFQRNKNVIAASFNRNNNYDKYNNNNNNNNSRPRRPQRAGLAEMY